MKCPSPVRGRRADIGFNILIEKRFPALGREQGSASSDLGKSQLLRRRQSMLAVALGAGALLAALGLLPDRANAQGAGNIDPFLRPVLDGDPRNPPRFSSSRSPARASTSRFTAVPNYRYQPAIGAGTTGFDSTGAPRRPKGVQKGRTSGTTKATLADSTPPPAPAKPAAPAVAHCVV